MELLPEALRAQIPRLGATYGEHDPMLWAKITNPVSGWRWYLIEREPRDTDAVYYVYEVGWDDRLTYFNHADLERHAAEVGAPNQFDPDFAPCRLSEVKERDGLIAIKFPLGDVVATAGAVAAFAATGQRPVDFLKRHVQGDWGELDAEDRAENEFSLISGFRLLSRYTLSDGTIIYIITEADRSVTTFLLPQEY